MILDDYISDQKKENPMSYINNLFIRTDANSQVGIGHFMRCLAFAQAWKKQGGKVIFISMCESKMLRNRISYEGFQLVKIGQPYPNSNDLETTLLTLNNSSAIKRFFIIDGYHFDIDYEKIIKNNVNRLLVIDDSAHLNGYVADIILNQNIIAKKLIYSCEPETKLLLGTNYVLLRDEFIAYKNWKREIPKVAKKILVTMGGSDPDNVTLKVISALDQVDIDGLEIKVVIGATNPHVVSLEGSIDNNRHKIELLQNVTTMPDLMARADMAISAAGSTCWELAYLGLPAILIITSENQTMNLEYLKQQGAVTYVNNQMNISTKLISKKIQKLIMDQELRNDMSYKGKLLVDGNGSERVVQAFQILNKKAKENNERENTTVNI